MIKKFEVRKTTILFYLSRFLALAFFFMLFYYLIFNSIKFWMISYIIIILLYVLFHSHKWIFYDDRICIKFIFISKLITYNLENISIEYSNQWDRYSTPYIKIIPSNIKRSFFKGILVDSIEHLNFPSRKTKNNIFNWASINGVKVLEKNLN